MVHLSPAQLSTNDRALHHAVQLCTSMCLCQWSIQARHKSACISGVTILKTTLAKDLKVCLFVSSNISVAIQLP